MTDQRMGNSPPLDPDVTRAQPSHVPAREAIGQYRLLERVGEGGMGEVWLAEQTGPVHRQVALKVIKAGMDTAQVVARFEAERQALAVMDHPAIARVFDAGATPQGRPYFVLEYVRGEGIASYCKKHKLSVHDRIDLFLQVCDGVQHAHQKGIIHRDLKPSNILVTIQDDRPVPKIIDFGVAKATTAHLTERTLYTELGVLIGTPEYMSPEQAEMSGLDIDTRTDVYALGVVLYELLTEALPFDATSLRAKQLDEIRRTIREIDPPSPSIRVMTRAASLAKASANHDAIRLASQLRGDIDWITMKALEKDRTRRYATVGDLAADLRRHLDNQPVLASPPSTMYRARKFVRRNRLGVSAAAIIIGLLVSFAATMTMQARRIARERDRANMATSRATREADTATQVSDFLVGLFKVSDPSESRGNTLTARDLLDKGATTIENTLSKQPIVQARLETTMANAYTGLGAYAAAEHLLVRAVDKQRRLLGPNHRDTLLALNNLANVYWYQARFSEAEPLYKQVVDISEQTLGASHADTLRAQFDLASLFIQERRWPDAEYLTRQVLEGQRRTLGVDDLDTLNSMNNLGVILEKTGRPAEAEPLYAQILDVQRRTLGMSHPLTLTTMHNLAAAYEAATKFSEAEKLYLDVVAAKRRVLGAGHALTVATVVRLARMYRLLRRYDDAEKQLLSAAETLTTGTDRATETSVLSGLAELYDAWGKAQQAAEWRAKLPKEIAAKR